MWTWTWEARLRFPSAHLELYWLLEEGKGKGRGKIGKVINYLFIFVTILT